MNECLFCKIINNDIPSQIVYEDETLLAFLDINPTTNGDTLIIPKKHVKDFQEIDYETLIKINELVKKLYPIYQKKLNCDGLTLSTNQDYGQEIKHFHLHFIPRYKDDQVKHHANKDILKPLEEIHTLLRG